MFMSGSEVYLKRKRLQQVERAHVVLFSMVYFLRSYDLS